MSKPIQRCASFISDANPDIPSGEGVVLNSPMPLILILVIVLLAVGGGGYYMGPGVGYYGGGTLDIIIGLIIIYLLFGRGRSRL
jgi:hypothetical protein